MTFVIASGAERNAAIRPIKATNYLDVMKFFSLVIGRTKDEAIRPVKATNYLDVMKSYHPANSSQAGLPALINASFLA